MKYLVLITAAMMYLNTSKAMHTQLAAKTTDSIYTQVDKVAEYSGGQKQLNKYLVKTLRYPAKALETNTQGEVVLQALIEKDGSISDLKVKTNVSPELDAEAARVIAKTPKWIPAQKNGEVVRSYRDIPVVFRLAN